MNTLKFTSQFKKDLKRYKHKTQTIDRLEAILKLLARVCRFRKRTVLTY